MRRQFWFGIGGGFLFGLAGVFSIYFFRAITTFFILGTAFSVGMATYEWLRQEGSSSTKSLWCGLLVGTMLLCGGFGLMQVIDKERVFISPTEAKLTYLFDVKPEGKPLMGYIDFLINSRSEKTLYQIWFKIILDSEFLTSKTVLLDFPTIEQTIKNGEPVRSAMLHSICFRGSKGKGDYRKEFYCFLDHLDPQNHFVVRLFSEFDANHLTEKQLGIVRTEVVKYSEHPARNLVSDPNATIGAKIEMIVPSEFSSDKWIIFCPDIEIPWKNTGVRFLCTYNSPGKITPKGANIQFKTIGYPSWSLIESTILNVTIGNIGPEVAYDLRLAVALSHYIGSRNDAVEEEVFARLLQDAHVDHETNLRVNEDRLKTIVTPKMTKEDITMLDDGRMLIFLVGFVTYKDLYGEHRVELCQVLLPPGDKDMWQTCHLHNKTIN